MLRLLAAALLYAPSPTVCAQPAGAAANRTDQLSSGLEVPTITLDPGATCLEGARLAARIARWREHAESDPTLRVQVAGDARDSTIVHYYIEGAGAPRTERVLRDAPVDCDQLHSAVALSIALALDAMVSGEGMTAPQLPIPPEPRRQQPRAAEQGHALALDLALLAGAGVGLLPNTSLVIAPRAQLALLPWFSLALEGLWTRGTDLTIGNAPGSFDADVWAGGLDACVGGYAAKRVSFAACVGGRGGAFITRGDATTLALSENVPSPWWALTAAGHARVWFLRAVGLGIGIEALYAPARRYVVVGNLDTGIAQSRRVPSFGLVISAGPVFRFF